MSSPVLHTPHSRRAVVDADAGPVRSSAAPLHTIQILLRSCKAAGGAAWTIPGFTSINDLWGLDQEKNSLHLINRLNVFMEAETVTEKNNMRLDFK